MNYDEPAFPVNFANETEWPMDDPFGREIPEYSNSQYVGITKRDYFAAKAMQALISKAPFGFAPSTDESYGYAAKGAYRYADAMIEMSNNEN
jgi:hypothetical protein